MENKETEEYIEQLVDHIKQLELENEDLSDCIRNLEKALDKACVELSERYYYEFDDLQTKEDWKEWFMNNE